MRTAARVTELYADGTAQIAVKRQSACGGSCDGCGARCAQFTPAVAAIAVNEAGAAAGDEVLVEMPTRTVLGAAAVVYLLPVALFFAGYAVTALAGAAGFLSGIALCVVYNNRVASKKRPRIVSKL